jgi:2'-5' RNA ligase
MQALGIGLLFPEHVSKKIDEFRIRYGNPRVRAVVPHITLKQPFSTTVEIGIILERLQHVAEKTPPFSVLLKRFEYFETERTMAYIAIDDAKPVSNLHSQIVHALHGLTEGGDEYEFDRFIPHITINDEIPKDRLSSFKSELATYEFSMEAILDTFVLFANDGTGWKHIHTFHLTG